MSNLVAAKRPPAWRAQDGESPQELVRFLVWALMGGPLEEDLAARHDWGRRRLVIETYEGLNELTPAEMATEAALARVRITFTEIMKWQQLASSSPDPVLAPSEVMQSVEWMTAVQKDLLAARASTLDWTKLTPEERDIMIRAKEIQDRMWTKG